MEESCAKQIIQLTVGVFKSKSIQIKTANGSIKTKNRTKSNIIGYVSMTFCENRLN